MQSKQEPKRKVVGCKQVTRALQEGRAVSVFLARGADPAMIEPIRALCRQKNVPWEEAASMDALGQACGIARGAAAAAVIR